MPKSRLNLLLLLFGAAAVSWALARYTANSDSKAAPAPFLMEMMPHPNLDRLGQESQAQVNAARTQCELLLTNPRSTDPLLRARAVAEVGKHYYAYNYFDAAVTCFDFASKWQPTEFRWPYLLGQAHRQNGNMDQAADSIERALAILPLDMSVSTDQGTAMLTALGDIYLAADQLDQAESHLQKALEEDSECGMALMKLGQVAAARGERQKAIGFFERVLEAAPRARSVMLLLAAEYRKDGQVAKAEKTLEQAKSLRAEQSIAHRDSLIASVRQLDRSHQKYNRAGTSAMKSGRLKQALQLFQKGLEIAPDTQNLLINSGIAWERLHNHQKARELWLRVLEAGAHEKALSLLGRSHDRAGDHEQALAYIQQALELNPNSVQYRYMLASAYSHAGSFDKALQAFGEVLAADPAHLSSNLGEVRMLTSLRRYDEALARAERCVLEFPEFSGGTIALAHLLAACPVDNLRDGPRAVELIRPMYDKKKSVANAETMAMAFAEVGDFEQAIAAQTWAVDKLAPTKLESIKAHFQKQLSMYENKHTCREPWSADATFPTIRQPVTIDVASEDGTSEEVAGETDKKNEPEPTPPESTP